MGYKRTVLSRELTLEEIRACLIVMKGMGMAKGMESIAAAIPSQLVKPVLKDLGNGSFIDVGTIFLAREKPVIRFCGRTVFFPILIKDVFEAEGKFDLAGVTALAYIF